MTGASTEKGLVAAVYVIHHQLEKRLPCYGVCATTCTKRMTTAVVLALCRNKDDDNPHVNDPALIAVVARALSPHTNKKEGRTE